MAIFDGVNVPMTKMKFLLPHRKRSAAVDRDELTKQNSSSSSFLRLPAEIRLKIYEYVLGHHVIDIEDIPRPVNGGRSLHYAHNVCNNDRLCAITRFFTLVDAGRRALHYSSDHNYVSCSMQGKRGKLKWQCWGLFSCCRQVSDEAKMLAYRENIWWFWTVNTCVGWVLNVRSKAQAANLTRLGIVTAVGSKSPDLDDPVINAQTLGYWEPDVVRTLVTRLTGLRHLWVQLKVHPFIVVTSISKNKGDWRAHERIMGVLEFAYVDDGLKTARVLVDIGGYFRRVKEEDGEAVAKQQMVLAHMTEPEVTEYAMGVESALLKREVDD